MRLLLLPKWDQPCAKKVAYSEFCADMLPTTDIVRVAICEDCRHQNHPLTESDYFCDLYRHLGRNTKIVARRVSLIQPSEQSLKIVQTCDVFYMCGGDPGQIVPRDFADALSMWHAHRSDFNLPGTPESIVTMSVLNYRVVSNEILFMGSCMGAMMAGETYFGMDIKPFDFMQGTSLEYESGTPAAACTTNAISAKTIKITSGTGVAVHVWADKRIVKQFQTTKNNNGWWDWAQMVSGIYEAEEAAQKMASRRSGPFCLKWGRWYFRRLSGVIEMDQRSDEDGSS